MFRLGKTIRRYQENARQERELNRAYRAASGSDMRAELSNLTQFAGR